MGSMSFDHFSAVSCEYARFRPGYPEALFNWVAGLCAERELAWDVACGSGQATGALAARFRNVVGTDISAPQLQGAASIPNIEWRIATAERSGFAKRSVDLITVAQALHWFDLEAFWSECRRVLTPNGMVAVWCYSTATINHTGANRIFQAFYHGVVGKYWPDDRRMVEGGYAGVEFPFGRIPSPGFRMTAQWNAGELAGYCASWSATKRCLEKTGVDTIPGLLGALEGELGDERVEVEWPLHVHAGRMFHVEH